jgi:hypothetical protein
LLALSKKAPTWHGLSGSVKAVGPDAYEETIRSARVNFATEERQLRDVDKAGYQTQRVAHRMISDELRLFHGFVAASRSVTLEQCVHAMD